MIAKRVPNPKKTSSIKQLIIYIANPEKQLDLHHELTSGIHELATYMDKQEAVVRVSNCCFEGMLEAIREIEATQKRNTRSRNDKTYHLVISFREGEQLDKNVLNQIEDRLIDKIGLGEHQRISALHTDTNNWHLHVAINKVHPSTFRNIEPYYDKFKMSEACRELEDEFGLLKDNGIQPNRKIPINPAQDKEAHTGTKSLVSWIRDNAAQEIQVILSQENITWSELHKKMNHFGLTIRPRGAGFVIQDLKSGLTVKASSVDRAFSKKKIEEKLGAYQDPQATHEAQKNYQEGPVQRSAPERDKLWEKYQEERNKNRSTRGVLLKEINDKQRDSLKKVFADIRKRKKEAKDSAILNWRQKKRIYAALQVERLRVLEKAQLSYSYNREMVSKRYPGLTWTAFLQQEAENGNTAAIQLLRQGKGKSIHDNANYIGRTTNDRKSLFQGAKYRVDKRGRIKYQLEKGWVLDAGTRIQPGSDDKAVILASLQIAVGRYGKKLKVEGTRDFVDRVTNVAREGRLNIIINGQQVNKGQQKGLSR